MRLSDLWSVLLLAAAAAGFLFAGRPLTKEAAAAVGFALAGAAITRAVDIRQEHRRDAAAAQQRRRADLDETRRLAYMALIHPAPGPRPELLATVANALAHHGHQVPFQEAAFHIGQVLSVDSEGESHRWLQEQIDRITAELDAQRP
jgi:hypothetical protein